MHIIFCQDTTHIVKYIWPGLDALWPSPSPQNLTDVNGKLFFFYEDSLYNLELWRSDGTEAGTSLIKYIRTPHYCRDVINSNGTLFFLTDSSACENITGFDGWPISYMYLWKSDGTEVNTVRLQLMQTDGLTPKMTKFNQTVVFRAWDDLHGTEIWKINDTHSGAVVLKDIYPGPQSSWSDDFCNVTDGDLYFSANDGTNGLQLWKSNGTEAGTNIVTVIPASFPEPYGAFISYLTTVGQNVFFMAYDSLHGVELWESDGTKEGTKLVKGRPGIDFGLSTYITSEHPFKEMNNILYFMANDGVHGFELWRSDGTEEGTYMLKDINPGQESSLDYTMHNWLIPQYASVNGTLFFVADDGIHGQELWKTDGSEDGTVLVKDIHPGGRDNVNYPQNLTICSGTLYFTADDGLHGTELWSSDGSEEGTKLVLDIFPGINSSNPGQLTVSGNKLFFTAFDSLHGGELWVSIPEATKADENKIETQISFNLYQNYPNPFNPTTTISYDLPKRSNAVIKIYNIIGEEVATLINAEQIAGKYKITWNGSGLASGVYFYRLKAVPNGGQVGNFVETKKLILLR